MRFLFISIACLFCLCSCSYEPGIVINSPLEYEVFQRKTKYEGIILLDGVINTRVDELEVLIEGTPLKGELDKNWRKIPITGNKFSYLLEVPAGGWYTVKLRGIKNHSTVMTWTIKNVGIGEVFVGAGQSNSTNAGEKQMITDTGMVSSFDGESWRLGNDPQRGVPDNSAGGSYYPVFGDILYEKYKVPVGITATGFGGTSVSSWVPGSELYNSFIDRINKLGKNGFRAVLWHQGESDFDTPKEDYVDKMTEIISSSKKDAGWEFSWFVAKASYNSPDFSAAPDIRSAQQQLWDKGIALPGPDTDTLTGEMRDENGSGIHFSEKGLKAHGKMWAECVSKYLDETL